MAYFHFEVPKADAEEGFDCMPKRIEFVFVISDGLVFMERHKC